MAQKNPFYRLHWFEVYPRLVREDVSDLVKSLLALYPEAVMFDEELHFSYKGCTPKPAEFFRDPAEGWRTNSATGNRGGIIAFRVPTREDIASDDPEKLIGGRDRSPFSETIGQSRRFGRCLYIHGMGPTFNEILEPLTAEDLALGTPYHKDSYRDLRKLKDAVGIRIHCPHDADNPEHVAFIKSVRSAVSPLTTRSLGIYDARTGEPIGITPSQPVSKRFLKRCVSEPDLCWSDYLVMDGVSTVLGPPPKLRRKWLAEAGLPCDFKTAPESVRVIPYREQMAQTRAGRWKTPELLKKLLHSN